MLVTRQLAPNTWKLLRALVRTPLLTGRELRDYDYGARTKDGTFLDKLATKGLLKAVKTNPDDSKPGRQPVQFRTVYELTLAGQLAAEHGEYKEELNLNKSPSLVVVKGRLRK